MGLLDGNYQGGLLGFASQPFDPTTAGLFAAAQALARGGQPSRVPTSLLGDIGESAAAFGQGAQQQQMQNLQLGPVMFRNAVLASGGDLPGQGQAAAPGQAAPGSPAPSGGQGGPTTAPGGDTFMGLPLPPGVSRGAALNAYAMDPTGGTLKELIAAAVKQENIRPGGAQTDSFGRPLYQQPVLPQGMTYQNGVATPVPGANTQHAVLSTIDQQAQQAREEAVRNYDYKLNFGGGPGGQTPPAPVGAPGRGMAGIDPNTPVWQGDPATGKGRMVPIGSLVYDDKGLHSSSSPPVGAGSVKPSSPFAASQPTPTDHGTVLPALSQYAPINRSAEYLKARMPQWAETENAWGNSIEASQETEQRAMAIMDALKQTQSGEWATDKAAFAAKLKAVGIDVGDKLGNVAQVQTALKDNWSETLSNIKAFSSRGTQFEVKEGAKNFANPNLQPEANRNIAAQTIGTLRWDRAMMNDWALAKAQGVQDPQDFKRVWTKANPLQGFINQAKDDIGKLKGETGAPVAGAGANALPTGGKLPKFSSPTDPNIQMLPKGAHFLDANGVERIKP